MRHICHRFPIFCKRPSNKKLQVITMQGSYSWPDAQKGSYVDKFYCCYGEFGTKITNQNLFLTICTDQQGIMSSCTATFTEIYVRLTPHIRENPVAAMKYPITGKCASNSRVTGSSLHNRKTINSIKTVTPTDLQWVIWSEVPSKVSYCCPLIFLQ